MEKQNPNIDRAGYSRHSVVERQKFGRKVYMERRIMYVVPFAGLINPLSQDQIVPATQELISGESFDFASESAGQRDWEKLESKNSPFLPILLTILNSPEIESGKACAILTDDLKRFSPDKSLLSSPNLLKEWLFKLTLGVWAQPSIAIRKLSHDEDLIDFELGRYYKEVKKQVGRFRQTLASLRKDDLDYYIRFEDMFHFYGTNGLLDTPSPTTLPDEMKEVISTVSIAAVADNITSLRRSLLEEDKNAWDRLRVNWRTKQIQQVLSLLPNIRSSTVIDHVVCALEDNFFGFSEIAPQDRKEKLKIDPLGIIALLKWKSQDVAYGVVYDAFAKTYPRVILQLKENLEFTNFSVPRKHLPHTAIRILAETAKRSDNTEFANLIKSVHELTVGENVNVSWFITLLALRCLDPETSEVIEQVVNLFDDLPVSVREIFLSSRPGKLWLTKDGKLRSTDTRTILLSTFPIFTSLAEDSETIEQEAQNPKKEKPKKPDAKNLAVNKIDNIPFFGEFGIIKEDADAKNIIFCLFEKKQFPLDEEKLLDEFGKLSDGWIMADPDRNRNLLYIARLNVSDDKFNEASEHGIEAVYIKGEEAVLIIRKDLAVANVSDKTIPIGLNGKIDESGQFIIEGMDESFVGEREHLFLNNLVLHLALQPLLYKSGIPEETDRSIVREINKVASFWNRSSSRGSLPKIERTIDNPYIALRIDGYKEPVLVGEKLK